MKPTLCLLLATAIVVCAACGGAEKEVAKTPRSLAFDTLHRQLLLAEVKQRITSAEKDAYISQFGQMSTDSAIAFAKQIGQYVESESIVIAERLKWIEDFDASNYRGTIDGPGLEADQFRKCAMAVLAGEASESAADKKLAKTLRAKLSALQAREFPAMRREYVSILKEKLWREDVEVSSSGANITLVAAGFAANANIEDTQTVLSSNLQKLRFKKAFYHWYRGSEGTYYKMDTPADAAVSTD